MQVTLTAVNRKERVSSRTGKPFISLGIKTNEHGEKWLSGFDSKETKEWKSGDKVEIEVEQKGEYLNFSVPKKADMGPAANNAGLAEIKNILRLDIEERLKGMEQRLGAKIDAIYGILEQSRSDDEMPSPRF